MKVLLIAPTSELEGANKERDDVINYLQPRVLLDDNATVDGIMRAVRLDKYDLIWFAGHGRQPGLELADGEFLTGKMLTQFLRGSECAIFLNSCNSYNVAFRLQQEIGLTVVCTVGEVDDEQAYRTGSAFAYQLSEGHNVEEAYQLAKPGGNQQFLLLNGNLNMSRHSETDDLMELMYEMNTHISGLDARLKQEPRQRRRNIYVWIAGYVALMTNIVLLQSYAQSYWSINIFGSVVIFLILTLVAGHLLANGHGFSFRKNRVR